MKTRLARGRRADRIVRTLAAGLVLLAGRAAAYDLYDESTCTPGSRWDTGTPVTVRLMVDSFVDYADRQNLPSPSAALADAIEDIHAVVDEYNSIAGLDLLLEVGPHVLFDDNLDDYGVDDFPDRTIVIGFTTASNDGAPAWAPHDPDDGCEYTQAHIYFRKAEFWDLGPPPNTDVNGKYFGDGTSFRAVLLHEMGHALGLAHPATGYAVMDHGTKAWTRGPNEVPQMELLPDDIDGLRALYGNGGGNDFDVSVTNTWFLPESFYPDDDAANQIEHCWVSSRGDAYVPMEDGAMEWCGVNVAPSQYDEVGYDVCPGRYLQLRYTVNNKSDQTVDLEEQVWLSLDDDLEVAGAAADLRSPDVRRSTIGPERSAPSGRVFRVPASAPDGTYAVYARVVPYHTVTGFSLWSQDEDQWNNSIRVRGRINVDSSVCP
jgi:hypothetical protein